MGSAAEIEAVKNIGGTGREPLVFEEWVFEIGFAILGAEIEAEVVFWGSDAVSADYFDSAVDLETGFAGIG